MSIVPASLVFGIHAVESLLVTTSKKVLHVYVKQNQHNLRIKSLIANLQVHNIDYTMLDSASLDQMAPWANHQGIIAQVVAPQILTEHDLSNILRTITDNPLLLILDNIQDPHNLGACLRSADACGAHAIIIPQDRAVSVTATVAKVACGAAATVPVVQVKNLARSMVSLKRQGIWLFGLSETSPQTIYKADFNVPLALVLGNEGSGMRRLTTEHCDLLFHIPMQGTVASLNVAVAAGVCLYEAMRQRYHCF